MAFPGTLPNGVDIEVWHQFRVDGFWIAIRRVNLPMAHCNQSLSLHIEGLAMLSVVDSAVEEAVKEGAQ